MTEPVAPAETPTAPTAKPDVAKGSRGRRWAIGLSLFTLLTLAGLTAAAYWLGWPWAQAQWQRFEDLERQLYGENSTQLGKTYKVIGTIHLLSKVTTDAREYLQRAQAIFELKG